MFRILWYEGWPYPVTAHPTRHDQEASDWYVQMRDGTWYPVCSRSPGTTLEDVWEELEPVVREWLASR